MFGIQREHDPNPAEHYRLKRFEEVALTNSSSGAERRAPQDQIPQLAGVVGSEPAAGEIPVPLPLSKVFNP